MANYHWHNPSETPQDLTISLLEHITNNFSDGVRVGSGGFGDVYWGIYRDEKIAVKKLYDQNPGFNDAAFKKEFNNSLKLHHPNTVRLVGYCYETREIHVQIKPGEYEFIKKIVRILCFEYCQGGSLDKYIDEKFSERDLDTRLKIIRGISEGLNYLHNGQAQYMYHLDLKPENILLDEKNMPKIADFGLSRFLAITKTHITTSCTGTMGYMPPEYIKEGKISSKFDVFSLGVIILQVLAVPLGYSKYDDMSPREFVEQVRRNWNERPPMIASSELYRVKEYIDIALRCVEKEREKRPKIRDIVCQLEDIDAQHSVGPSRTQTIQVHMTDVMLQEPEPLTGVDDEHPAQSLNRQVEKAKQYNRLLDPFLAARKQDATSFDDDLWRLKMALNRIKDSTPRFLRCRTIDDILEEREKIALDLEKWRNGKLNDGKKTIQLGAVRKAVYQLEDMADDIEYTRWKQREAKYTTKLFQEAYITQRLRLVLKVRKTVALLHNLRGIMESFHKEFSSENCIAITTESETGGSTQQETCVSSSEDGKLQKPDVISRVKDMDCSASSNLEGQDSDSITEHIAPYEETSEVNDSAHIVSESDGQHCTKEDLLRSLFTERGNRVISYGLAQGTGKANIPVQDIFNDERVRQEFELCVCLCASDKPMSTISPEKRTLEESILELMNSGIVNIVSAGCGCPSNEKVENDSRTKKESISNLSQEVDETVIKEHFQKKILLVLDDVLEDQLPKIPNLLSVLSSGNTESRIVISSQSSEVLESLRGLKMSNKGKPADYSEKEGTEGPSYKGKEKEKNGDPLVKQKQKNIEDTIFWRFFRSFALRDSNKEASQEDKDPCGNRKMKQIGKSISRHLKRFPLGAKMIGKMLNTKRDSEFWAAISEKVRRVVESVECEHHQLLSLLKICYDELPAPLRLCFQYCSLFPSNWTFTSESLVRLWMSQGFLVKDLKILSSLRKDMDGVKTIDDVGKLYFDALHSRSFFEKLTNDGHTPFYGMHAFVHCFAQVTAGEGFMRIESNIRPEESVHVHHLSVESAYLPALCNVDALYRLRTLIIFGPINPDASGILEKILPRLRKTRTLDLGGCGMERFPEINNDLKKHLRYLSMYDTGIEKLPKDFYEFVHLQVLNILGCRIKKLPQKMTKLYNLRHVSGPTFLTSEMHDVGKLKVLQELEEFPVSRTHKIQELGGMKDLGGSITISNLEKVKYGNNAAKAKLHDKCNLDSLKLEWSSTVMDTSSFCGCSNISYSVKSRSAKVLERLKPHYDLRVLEINWYIGGKSPSWFTASVLGNIVRMKLTNCMNWDEPPPLGQLPHLKTLKLEKWDQLKSFGGEFPMLEELALEGMPELLLFDDISGSLPCLKLITIRNCTNLTNIPLLESSVLAEIYVEDVGLKNLPLRTTNKVDPSSSYPADDSIPESLTRLTMQYCRDLVTVGGTYEDYDGVCLPSSLLHLQITACEKIRYIGFEDPLSLKESHIMESNQLTEITSKDVKIDLPSLQTVHVDKISLLEPHFECLVCLEELVIEDAELENLGKLPSTLSKLKKLCLINCKKFEALPEDMKQFSSLKSLHLKNCHAIKSLPYLPYNLDELRIDDCPLLEKRYREDSAGWPMISHVPYKYI